MPTVMFHSDSTVPSLILLHSLFFEASYLIPRTVLYIVFCFVGRLTMLLPMSFLHLLVSHGAIDCKMVR